MILRPYQEQMLHEIKKEFLNGNKRLILQLATGGGKTAMFSAIAKMAVDKGNAVLIITHRRELLTQSGGTLSRFNLEAKELTAKTKEIEPGMLYVAMVETIKARIEKPGYADFVKSFKIIIIDEAHIQNFNRIFEMLEPTQYVIGATATPFREGKMRPLSADYDSIVPGVQIPDLIRLKYLTPAVSYGFRVDLSKVRITAGEFNDKDLGELYDENKFYTGAVEQYRKHADGTKFLAFAPTVKNSIRLASDFTAAGYPTGHIDAGTPDADRREILRDYNEGRLIGIVNVGILTTGFDQPDIETIILYRPTKSLPLFLQMCGRGSRPSPGKEQFRIIDFGNNIGRHGFWQDERTWSLEIKEGKKNREKMAEFPIRECPNCGALAPLTAKFCPECGFEFPLILKATKKAELVLLDPELDRFRALTPSQIQTAAEFASVRDLELIREAKGYKLGWVCHKLRTEARFREYEQLKGYKRGWAQIQYRRFMSAQY